MADENNFKVKDMVVDLVGGLGEGEIIDIYTNYNDDPEGEVLAVVRFGAEDDDAAVIVDRGLGEISTDLTAVPSLH